MSIAYNRSSNMEDNGMNNYTSSDAKQNIQSATSTITRTETKQVIQEPVEISNELYKTKEIYQSATRPNAYQFNSRKNQFRSGGGNGASFMNIQTAQQYNVPVQQYPQQVTTQQTQQQIHMNVIVVSKEEIEAPWRLECEYLQSIIQELELNTKTEVQVQVVKEYVKEYVNVENTDRVHSTQIQQIVIFEEEQRRLRDLVLQLQGENGRLKDLLDQSSRELQLKIRELDQYKSRGSESETRNSTLNLEMQRLKQQLDDRNGTIGDLQQKNNQYQLTIQQLNQEIDHLNQQLRARSEEIMNLKRQIETLNSSLQDSGRFREYENQNQLLKNEIDRINNLYKIRGSEYDTLRASYSEMESSYSRKVNEGLNKIRDLENTIMMLQSEIDRMNSILRGKIDEYERLRNKYEDLESQGVTVVQEKVTYLTQEVEVWKQRFIKVNHDFNSTQEELIMAQAELESIKKGGKKEVIVSRTTRTQNTNIRKSGTEDGGHSQHSYATTNYSKE